jgi:hypothetical protein
LDEAAASWSFKKILEHWAHKHAQAVYVPSKRQHELAKKNGARLLRRIQRVLK